MKTLLTIAALTLSLNAFAAPASICNASTILNESIDTLYTTDSGESSIMFEGYEFTMQLTNESGTILDLDGKLVATVKDTIITCK